MRTVLDVTVCTHSTGGVGRWVRGLSCGLSANSPLHLSIDLPETHPGQLCTVPGALSVPPPGWMSVPLLRRFMIRSGSLEKTRENRIRQTAGFPDIIHLSGVQPLGAGKARVVTFFDDTPWTEPENHTATTLFYASRLRDLVDKGAAVLAISSWSSGRAAELFSIPPERVGVAGGAADDVFTPGQPDSRLLRQYGLEPGGYLLHVGSFVPRKNIPFLLQCFSMADKRGRKLVLAGAEKWGLEEEIQSEDTVVLNSISDSLLLSLYRGAEALLVPSTSEGLGLPVLEALACGTPVISSDGGALPETVSGAGIVLPVNDVKAWTDSISAGATGDMKRAADSSPVKRWKDVGADALDFYGSLL